MVSFLFVMLIMLFAVNQAQEELLDRDFERVKNLVVQWAPLIWLSPAEKYFPSSVEYFLKSVYLSNEHQNVSYRSVDEINFSRTDTKSLFLVTNENLLEKLKISSFLNGNHPIKTQVPIYALVSFCTSHNSFHSSSSNTIKNDISMLFEKLERKKILFQVTYWAFYPYNRGKEICFLGKVPTLTFFGTCFGRLKTIGSHVGDWEHMTLSFRGKPFPSDMYLSVHDTGAYYKYDQIRRHFKYDSQRISKKRGRAPKFPSTVRMQMGHPVLFAANGSHGLWSSPGEHEYVKIPRLKDLCGYGVPWKTWKNLEIFNLGYDRLPKWMLFKGKWGNPSNNCVLSKRLGLCELYNGPEGILRNKQEFYC